MFSRATIRALNNQAAEQARKDAAASYIGCKVVTPAGLDGIIRETDGNQAAVETADGLEYWPAEYFNQADGTARKPATKPATKPASPRPFLVGRVDTAGLESLVRAAADRATSGRMYWRPTAESMDRGTAQTDRALAAFYRNDPVFGPVYRRAVANQAAS